ncbi:MAG: YlmC/YmxH family sporulation protein [Ruminococcaceae bacterium]|nr:YlmC/YmxH family sporulation protein [Oscillospiraceae bacterium]
MRLSDLRCREVICLADGRRLGYISDLEIDLSCGKIIALILPGPGRLKGLLSNGEFRVPWQEIASIGADLILVNRCEELCTDRKREKRS